jgi:hypothetical protein
MTRKIGFFRRVHMLGVYVNTVLDGEGGEEICCE